MDYFQNKLHFWLCYLFQHENRKCILTKDARKLLGSYSDGSINFGRMVVPIRPGFESQVLYWYDEISNCTRTIQRIDRRIS